MGELISAVAFQALSAVLFPPLPLAFDAPPLPGALRGMLVKFVKLAKRCCPGGKSTENGTGAFNKINHVLLTSLVTSRLLSFQLFVDAAAKSKSVLKDISALQDLFPETPIWVPFKDYSNPMVKKHFGPVCLLDWLGVGRGQSVTLKLSKADEFAAHVEAPEGKKLETNRWYNVWYLAVSPPPGGPKLFYDHLVKYQSLRRRLGMFIDACDVRENGIHMTEMQARPKPQSPVRPYKKKLRIKQKHDATGTTPSRPPKKQKASSTTKREVVDFVQNLNLNNASNPSSDARDSESIVIPLINKLRSTPEGAQNLFNKVAAKLGTPATPHTPHTSSAPQSPPSIQEVLMIGFKKMIDLNKPKNKSNNRRGRPSQQCTATMHVLSTVLALGIDNVSEASFKLFQDVGFNKTDMAGGVAAAAKMLEEKAAYKQVLGVEQKKKNAKLETLAKEAFKAHCHDDDFFPEDTNIKACHHGYGRNYTLNKDGDGNKVWTWKKDSGRTCPGRRGVCGELEQATGRWGGCRQGRGCLYYSHLLLFRQEHQRVQGQ